MAKFAKNVACVGAKDLVKNRARRFGKRCRMEKELAAACRCARGARENQLVTNYIKDKNGWIKECGEDGERKRMAAGETCKLHAGHAIPI